MGRGLPGDGLGVAGGRPEARASGGDSSHMKRYIENNTGPARVEAIMRGEDLGAIRRRGMESVVANTPVSS